MKKITSVIISSLISIIATDLLAQQMPSPIFQNLTLQGTLSASGSISGAGITSLFAPPAIGGTMPSAGYFSTLSLTGPFTLDAPGLVGDGVTNNNAALQAALTAATSGAPGSIIQLPCGTYKLTAAMTATIQSNSGLTIAGAGKDCTRLAFSGAVNGLVLTIQMEMQALSFEIRQNGSGWGRERHHADAIHGERDDKRRE